MEVQLEWSLILWAAAAVALVFSAAVIARSRLGLTVNETATLLLSTASLVVAALAYGQSLDNADMREAIGRLAFLGEQTLRQANATQMQVGQIREQTAEMGRQTGALRRTAGSTASLAKSTAAQFTQRDRQFALEQQPDVRWNEAANEGKPIEFFGDDRARGLVLWDFYFKNFGRSTARDLSVTEGISLYDGPFVEAERRSGNLGPGETGWFTVAYPAGVGNLPVPVNARPTLRIIFRFKDATGRRYRQVVCQRLQPPAGIIRNCLQDPIVKSPSIPFEQFQRRR